MKRYYIVQIDTYGDSEKSTYYFGDDQTQYNWERASEYKNRKDAWKNIMIFLRCLNENAHRNIRSITVRTVVNTMGRLHVY